MLVRDEVLGQPRAEKSVTAGYPNVQANLPHVSGIPQKIFPRSGATNNRLTLRPWRRCGRKLLKKSNELIGVVPVRQLPGSCSLLVVVAPNRGAQECRLPVSLSVHTRATSWLAKYLQRSVEYRPLGIWL